MVAWARGQWRGVTVNGVEVLRVSPAAMQLFTGSVAKPSQWRSDSVK
jgi:hypothetical protein